MFAYPILRHLRILQTSSSQRDLSFLLSQVKIMKLSFAFLLLTASPATAFLSQARSAALPFLLAQNTVVASRLNSSKDTPTTLPDFANQDEYLKYMQGVSDLPKGFTTGTADAKFISVESPLLGPLPIRGTIIYLTEGPTDNWAAVFTRNRVRSRAALYISETSTYRSRLYLYRVL
jgi:hypothetical protein